MKRIRLQRQLHIILTFGFTTLLLASCNQGRTQEEEAVLASSAFYQEEVAAAVMDTSSGSTASTDGGVVPGQPDQGATPDGGFIPDPMNPPSDPGMIPPPDDNSIPPVVSNPPTDPTMPPSHPPTTDPLDPTDPGTTPTDPTNPGTIPGDDGNVAGPGPGTPGTDGGTVPGGNDPGSNPDGGTVPPGTNPPTDPGTIPPVVTNPPVTPPTDPPTTTPNDPPTNPPMDPPTIPPVVTNPPTDPGMPPTDPGTTPTDPNGPPGTDGGNVPPGNNPPGGPPDGGTVPGGCDHLIKYRLTRVCSNKRSQIPSFVFFEDAERPIMAIVAMNPVPAPRSGMSSKYLSRWFQHYIMKHDTTKLASLGFGMPQTSSAPDYVRLKTIDLSAVDLHKGKYNSQFALDLSPLKSAYPSTWRDALVRVDICNDTNADGTCLNEPQNLLTMHEKTFKARHVPKFLELPVWHGRFKNSHNAPDQCEEQYSPLVLDIQGNGISLTSVEESGVYFDLNNNDQPVYTGWIGGADDVFLVMDRNGNGRIDDGGELFGSATILANGARADNGFEALKELDTDRDGRITPRDSAWHRLAMWRDRDRNGRTDSRELYRLSQAAIQSISLNYVDIMEVDPHGNETRQRSTYERKENGRSVIRQIVDVWFRTLAAW